MTKELFTIVKVTATGKKQANIGFNMQFAIQLVIITKSFVPVVPETALELTEFKDMLVLVLVIKLEFINIVPVFTKAIHDKLILNK